MQLWTGLFAEVCPTLQEVIFVLGTARSLFFVQDASHVRPHYYLVDDSAPTVDICVTCCGESVDVVVNTVAAALTQNYPSQRFHVFLLDDGNDEKLQRAVKALNEKQAENNGPQVLYLARKPESPLYSKAGNLQFEVEQTKLWTNSEFFASLDADMIVKSDWLRKMIPHLILEDELALACPPQVVFQTIFNNANNQRSFQRYYNIPENDPLGQQAEFDTWFTIYEPLNDRLNAAICTGSGFIVRRSALERDSAYRCILSMLPNTTVSFQSSGSIMSPVNERSRHRKPLPYRFLSLDLTMYFIYIIYTSGPLLCRPFGYTSPSEPSSGSLFPFPSALVKLLECIGGALVPLHYMLFPPTVPERRELVEEDEQGVMRPKKRQVMVSNQVVWTDVCERLIIYLCDWW